VRVTARLAYGLGALVDLAAAGRPVKGVALAGRYGVSVGFLENILAELRRAGFVQSKRGGQGGYWLARPATEITVADVMRALDGGRVEADAATHDGLASVWQTIARATMDAAESFTLASMVGAEARTQHETRFN
jgi:Rrf2 family protein